jgi:hypothetical protein
LGLRVSHRRPRQAASLACREEEITSMEGVTEQETWRDRDALVADRVRDLMAKMTTGEKVGHGSTASG